MSINVARPGTALDGNSLTGAIITSTAPAGAAGTKFYLKVTDAQFRGSVPVVETTGSGEARVRYQHGDLPYYDITLRGVMLGDAAINLAALTEQIDPADGETDITLNFKFSGHSTHDFTNMKVVVTNVEISWDAKLPVVGVAMQMKSMLATNKGLEGDLA
jgi:hypothetical protein